MNALGEIEPVLFDLRAATAMLGHMASSDDEVDADHLHFIENQLIDTHRKLVALWHQAWKDRNAERKEHNTELAKAQADVKAAAGVPGGPAQIRQARAHFDFLRVCARVTLEQCDKYLAAVDQGGGTLPPPEGDVGVGSTEPQESAEATP